MLESSTRRGLLILDCDGVVVDSEPITLRVLVEMINELGPPISMSDARRRFVGIAFVRLLELVGQHCGVTLPQRFAKDYGDRTFAAMEAELKPVEGIVAALDQISIPYCIASNGPHAKMRKTLAITSLLSRFEGRMFSSDDVARGKPSPDLFLLAAERFGVRPSDCLVIEDSASGVIAGVAAGMKVLGYCEWADEQELVSAGAHGVFRTMSELPSLVG